MRTRAAVSYSFREPLVIESVELSPPSARQVCVRIDAVAVCHSDISFIDGRWAAQLPAVWGHEAAGTVVDVGTDVADIAPGDRVVATLIRSCGRCSPCGQGLTVACTGNSEIDSPITASDGTRLTHGMGTASFAEHSVVDASQVARIPDALSIELASLLACGVLTGVGAVVNTAAVPAGAAVVVIGTGGVGLNTVQGARIAGADPIIAVDPSDDRLATAGRLGATHAINPQRDDVVEAVMAMTRGALAEFVFVTSGAPAALDLAPAATAAGGAIVLVGMPPDGVTMDVDAGTLAARNQRILGSRMGTSVVGRDIPRLVDLHQRGELELASLVSGRYPLEEINDAIDNTRAGRAIRNVITMGNVDVTGVAP